MQKLLYQLLNWRSIIKIGGEQQFVIVWRMQKKKRGLCNRSFFFSPIPSFFFFFFFASPFSVLNKIFLVCINRSIYFFKDCPRKKTAETKKKKRKHLAKQKQKKNRAKTQYLTMYDYRQFVGGIHLTPNDNRHLQNRIKLWKKKMNTKSSPPHRPQSFPSIRKKANKKKKIRMSGRQQKTKKKKKKERNETKRYQSVKMPIKIKGKKNMYLR